MEAIVKRSGLNPLATCFVPSNFKKSGEDELKKLPATRKYEEKTKNKAPNVKHVTDVIKFKATKYRKGKKKKLDIFLPHPLVNDILNCKDLFCKRGNDNVYFTKDVTKMEIFKQNDMPWPKLDTIVSLKLILMLFFKFYTRQNSLTYIVNDHDEKSNTVDNLTSNEECCCPPMFGYSIPPEFFGNPLKLNPICNKKFVHVCHYPNAEINNRIIEPRERKSPRNKDLLDVEWTKLDKYTFELEKVVKDVCEIVNLATCDDMDLKKKQDSVSCINSKCRSSVKVDLDYKIKAEYEETHNDIFSMPKISSKPDSSNLENLVIEMGIPMDTQTIDDDDFHPLLDEGISMMDNDEEVSPVIKKMIEISLSPTRKEQRLSFDPEELSENTCNPPCSFWCDSLPQHAKDTYRKFIKSLPEQDKRLSEFELKGRISEHEFDKDIYGKFRKNLPERVKTAFNGENLGRPKFPLARQFFKRSFSANDCPEPNEDVAPIQRSFETESLTKQVPGGSSNYLKSCYLNNQTSKDRSKTQYLSLNEEIPSFYLFNQNINTKSSKDGRASEWGPFDGEDSLWQPLPDCAASNENKKQSSHKKVRELRLQKSLI